MMQQFCCWSSLVRYFLLSICFYSCSLFVNGYSINKHLVINRRSILISRPLLMPTTGWRRAIMSMNDNNNNNNQESDNLSKNASSSNNDEGRQLASLFYQEIAAREESSKQTQEPQEPQQSQQQQTPYYETKQKPAIVSKTPVPSSRLSSGSSVLFSLDDDDTSSSSDKKYQNELKLAGRFEKTLGLQAVLVALAWVLVIVIGITGGITDGSERYYDDDGNFDLDPTVKGPPEVIMIPSSPSPIPEENSSSKSVWL